VYPATLLPAYIVLFLSIFLAARQTGVSFHTLKKAVTGDSLETDRLICFHNSGKLVTAEIRLVALIDRYHID
jgi:hypothetical protein